MRRAVVFSLLSAASILLTRPSAGGPREAPLAGIETDAERVGTPHATLVAEFFRSDPLSDPRTIVVGAALERLTHDESAPAWPGDRRGSLTALYDSSLPAGLFGFALPVALDEADAFTAAATFVLDPAGFEADPNGFFQISWGLWNTETTGLNRTGSFTSFAGDAFDLVGFDYFPAVSPFFGGPFLSPSVFGASRPDVDPPDAFANAAFAFNLEVALPLGVPLLAMIEHEPGLDVAVASVHRIVRPRRTVPVPGAVTVIDLGALALRQYGLDAVGLTLWNDGFGGPTPALRASVDYHSLVVVLGRVANADEILRVRPGKW
jgi:hypothetical protein